MMSHFFQFIAMSDLRLISSFVNLLASVQVDILGMGHFYIDNLVQGAVDRIFPVRLSGDSLS